jgi:hypothetical protein
VGWFTGHRRLTIRSERQLDHFLACRQLSAAITHHSQPLAGASTRPMVFILTRQPSATRSCALWGVSTYPLGEHSGWA